MAVNFDDLELIKEGTKEKTKIRSIEEGTQEQFRPQQYWDAVKDKDNLDEQMKAKAVKITTENSASIIIAMPKTKKVHPKSTLALFKATYGEYPKVGLLVTTKIDENGFNKIVVEK